MANSSPAQKEKTISLRIPVALDKKANDAAKKLHLKKSDVFRLATERGIDVLLTQLSTPTAAA
jgi:hypothetical protein